MGGKTIEVRDRKNPDRILGTYQDAPSHWRGRFYEVAMRSPLFAVYEPYMDAMSCQETFRTARFEIGTRPSEDGYDLIGVFLTDTPLDDLLQLPAFELPKPKRKLTAREEYERRMRQRTYYGY